MIKNVIFDMGNVLLRWDPEYIVSNYDTDEIGKGFLLNEVIKTKYWLDVDKGIISYDDLLDIVKNRIPSKYHAVAKHMCDTFENYMEELLNATEVLSKLKSEDYNLYILSNSCLKFRSILKKQRFYSYLDGILLSSEEKMLKPDTEIFKLMCDRYELNPSESLFIDDIKANVDGAISAGLKGEVYDWKIQDLYSLVKEVK